MSRNPYFWNTLLDKVAADGTEWRPPHTSSGYAVVFKTTDEDVLNSVETLLYDLDEEHADSLVVAHGPNETVVLYFSNSVETVSLVFSKDVVSGRVTVDGSYMSDRFGLISSFFKGSPVDGLTLASAVL